MKVIRYIIWLLLIPILIGSINSCSCNEPNVILVQASESILNVDSFHAHATVTRTVNSSVYPTYEYTVDYVAPDRLHHTLYSPDGSISSEIIFISNLYYSRFDTNDTWHVSEVDAGHMDQVFAANAVLAQPEKISETIGQLVNVEVIGDEVVNGITCTHIRGVVPPIEFNIEEYREQIEAETDPVVKAQMEQWLEQYLLNLEIMEEIEETSIHTQDFWIGKDDQLIFKSGQAVHTSRIVNEQTTETHSTVTVVFSKLNEYIEIEAPTIE